MDNVIDVVGLTKRFGRTRALDGLDLRVRAGRVHGFLGPNGAGKSTTIRVLLGLIRADGGTARLFGEDPWRRAVALHERLAYVPGDVALWPNLTGGQCIDVLASAGSGLDESRRADLIERFALDVTKKADDYSKGNRQKVALIAALASRADLLVLDEPTSGLDPLMEEVFQESVRERVNEGVTVLLSSHILAEVESLSHDVTIIRAGRTLRSGGLDELRRGSRIKVHARTHGEPDGLAGMAGVGNLEITPADGAAPGERDVRFDVGDADLDRAMAALVAVGVGSLTVRPPSLDELFLSSYETAEDTSDATVGAS
ncbi:ABC transporter ATP-binding protein [Gordonia rhizosphera]|uniref:Putative ABC transporter ATP-binding protein n=1 Tax=Gordonia rhizosphera NBRC 16068 TaxID=1108045 RepID=K6V104_9ACTN|nr:ABC transporter ATP-binding protein [Gordonia rhizosphera]GAB89588.1 putative ABC transporter ATP-binding protein [Gordonia rhizosphera NBRC 16068]